LFCFVCLALPCFALLCLALLCFALLCFALLSFRFVSFLPLLCFLSLFVFVFVFVFLFLFVFVFFFARERAAQPERQAQLESLTTLDKEIAGLEAQLNEAKANDPGSVATLRKYGLVARQFPFPCSCRSCVIPAHWWLFDCAT
jgi:preprotein translocase subunit YajC